MKNVCAVVVAASAGLAAGSVASGEIPAGIAACEDNGRGMLARAMLPLMPEDQRWQIIRAGGIGAQDYDGVRERSGEFLVAHDERYERLRHAVSPNLFARMSDEHLGGLLASLERGENGETPIALCFAPGTDPELVAAYNLLFEQELWGGGEANGDPRFQIGDRWTTTASDFSTGPQGTPITLTYSFAPDGALADNLSGANRSNELNAWLNSLYGSQAVWQPLFDSIFNDWGEITGVSYIYEPNDDGREANTSGGVLGTRGDVRIFAVRLDGGGGVLAYNAFPNAGDMVFDAFDSFYNSFSNNSRRFRNVAAHEHGHGLGFNHVCPTNQTKLMEPFASTAFDSVQLDDILAGQRNYGDYLEPNDSSFDASPLGSFSIGSSTSVETVSIDDNSDIDFYSLSTTQPLELVVTVSPAAAAYLNGPQNFNGSCSSGVLTDYNDNQDLSIQLRASNGTTVIGTVNDAPAGSVEEARFTVTSPGDYFIVIDDPGTENSIQLYDITVAGEPVPFDGPTIVAQGNAPSTVLPGQPVTLDYEVLANADTIVDGPDLLYRFDGGSYIRVPMSAQGNDIFRATIPAAACGDQPEYYIEVEGDFVGQVNLPLAGAADPFSYGVGSFTPSFEDDFESFTGWSDTISTASAGEWDRGVPVASVGAPPSDFDGSGQCYVTGNTAGEDVDFGLVILRSPAVDIPDGGVISFAYWLSAGGGSLNGDTLELQISTNQQITWTTIRTYSTPTDAWVTESIEIDADTGVNNFFFRFVAEDQGADNTMEAAIDAVAVGTLTCDDTPGGCNAADVAEPFGVLDLGDINGFVTAFTNQDPIADINGDGIFDLGDLGQFTSAFLAGCP
jgi:hypothetical protein